MQFTHKIHLTLFDIEMEEEELSQMPPSAIGVPSLTGIQATTLPPPPGITPHQEMRPKQTLPPPPGLGFTPASRVKQGRKPGQYVSDTEWEFRRYRYWHRWIDAPQKMWISASTCRSQSPASADPNFHFIGSQFVSPTQYHVSPADVSIANVDASKTGRVFVFLWASGCFQNIWSGWNLGLADVRWASGSIFGQNFDLLILYLHSFFNGCESFPEKLFCWFFLLLWKIFLFELLFVLISSCNWPPLSRSENPSSWRFPNLVASHVVVEICQAGGASGRRGRRVFRRQIWATLNLRRKMIHIYIHLPENEHVTWK